MKTLISDYILCNFITSESSTSMQSLPRFLLDLSVPDGVLQPCRLLLQKKNGTESMPSTHVSVISTVGLQFYRSCYAQN